jgi:hypothetical protein
MMESSDFARAIQVCEKLPDASRMTRQNQFGRYFGQGCQNEPALAESGMGNDDLRVIQDEIANVQNVQINSSWRVSGFLRRAAHLSLDL